MSRPQKKYHFIYKTACLLTGKFYVGMHSTNDLNDGYLGSGKILRYSIKKHGAENHQREIIEMCPSRESLKLREKEIVNEQLLADPLNINLKYGGEGGWEIQNLLRTNVYGRNGTRGYGQENLKRGHTSERASAIWAKHRSTFLAVVAKSQKAATLAAKTPEALSKRKKTLLERQHQVGVKNSQFGTCWVTNGNPIKIKKEHLEQYLNNGYIRGRKKFIGTVAQG